MNSSSLHLQPDGSYRSTCTYCSTCLPTTRSLHDLSVPRCCRLPNNPQAPQSRGVRLPNKVACNPLTALGDYEVAHVPANWEMTGLRKLKFRRQIYEVAYPMSRDFLGCHVGAIARSEVDGSSHRPAYTVLDQTHDMIHQQTRGVSYLFLLFCCTHLKSRDQSTPKILKANFHKSMPSSSHKIKQLQNSEYEAEQPSK